MKKIFLALIVLLGIISTILPDKSFSDGENRLLQTFPNSDILSGQFMQDMDSYLTDQFVGRDQFLQTKTYLEKFMLKKCINNVFITDNRLFNRYSEADFNKTQIEKNIKYTNSFVNKYNAKVFLIPNSYEVYSEELPFYCDNLELNHYFTSLKNVNIMDSLMNEHKDEYIYYNTDHHWTTLGAYYFYSQLVEDPVEYNPELVDNEFLGTIHSKINIKFKYDSIFKHNSASKINVYYDMGKDNLGMYFDKYLEGKDKYSYFLDSNHAIVHFENENAQTDKSILVVKDSFSNCLAPFLAETYSNVYLVDLRYFNGNVDGLIKTLEIDEYYVIYNKVNFLQDENLFKLN